MAVKGESPPKGNRHIDSPTIEKKGKRQKRTKEDKWQGSPIYGAMITLLVFVLLIGAATCFFVFDLFGTRGMVIGFLNVTDEAYERNQEKLAQWQTDLAGQAEQLVRDQKIVSGQQSEMEQREAAVKKKEDDLNTRIAEYDDMIAQLKPKSDDILTVAKALETMSADAAANLLMEMSDMDAMLRLFASLKPSTQAAILETMDARTAATLVEGIS